MHQLLVLSTVLLMAVGLRNTSQNVRGHSGGERDDPPAVTVADRWSEKEYHQSLRELIRHEDMLTLERLKLLLAVQTLLVGGTAVFWSAQRLPIWILALFGIITAWSFSRELHAGNKSFDAITDAWDNRSTKSDGDTPPLVGEVDGGWHSPSYMLGLGLIALWVCVIAVLLYRWLSSP